MGKDQPSLPAQCPDLEQLKHIAAEDEYEFLRAKGYKDWDEVMPNHKLGRYGVSPAGGYVLVATDPKRPNAPVHDIKTETREEFYASLLAKDAWKHGDRLFFPPRQNIPRQKEIDFVINRQLGDIKGFGSSSQSTQGMANAVEKIFQSLYEKRALVGAVYLDEYSKLQTGLPLDKAIKTIMPELRYRLQGRYGVAEIILYVQFKRHAILKA